MKKTAILIALSLGFAGAIWAQDDVESDAAGSQTTTPAAAAPQAPDKSPDIATSTATAQQQAVTGGAAAKSRTAQAKRKAQKKKLAKAAAAKQAAAKQPAAASSQPAISINIDNTPGAGKQADTTTYSPDAEATAADEDAAAAEPEEVVIPADKSIPASYGSLKGVVPTDDGAAQLFFEDDGGTIRTVKIKSSGDKTSIVPGATIERSEK